MKRSYSILLSLLFCLSPIFGQNTVSDATPVKIVTIQTSAGTMKAKLYDDVPNHVKTFITRANRGEYNGTLFTRVLPEFMIQGGAPDSRNAPAGARCGFGDRNSEIMPEMKEHHFNKRGALAAPRQNDDINPQKKSDMSQFYIVQGKVYRSGELDTLEMIANQGIKEKAMEEFFYQIDGYACGFFKEKEDLINHGGSTHGFHTEHYVIERNGKHLYIIMFANQKENTAHAIYNYLNPLFEED